MTLSTQKMQMPRVSVRGSFMRAWSPEFTGLMLGRKPSRRICSPTVATIMPTDQELPPLQFLETSSRQLDGLGDHLESQGSKIWEACKVADTRLTRRHSDRTTSSCQHKQATVVADPLIPWEPCAVALRSQASCLKPASGKYPDSERRR